jgi:hypothetical protein
MFYITGGKGFQMTFENGWTVSVQFGVGNYGDNYSLQDYSRPTEDIQSEKAEIAAWDKNNKCYDFSEFDSEYKDTVKGYVKADQVLAFMNKISKL